VHNSFEVQAESDGETKSAVFVFPSASMKAEWSKEIKQIIRFYQKQRLLGLKKGSRPPSPHTTAHAHAQGAHRMMLLLSSTESSEKVGSVPTETTPRGSTLMSNPVLASPIFGRTMSSRAH
jgi:hypothetical protein